MLSFLRWSCSLPGMMQNMSLCITEPSWWPGLGIFSAPLQPQTCHYASGFSRFHECFAVQRGTKAWKKKIRNNALRGEKMVLRSPGMAFSKHHQGGLSGIREKKQAPPHDTSLTLSHWYICRWPQIAWLSVIAYARYPLSSFVISWQLSPRFAT